MASSTLGNLQLGRIGTAGFALLSVATGVQALLNPAGFATTFGLPTNGQTSLNPYVSVMAGRNLAGGLTLLAFSYYNDRRAMGSFMVAGLATGLTDAVICYNHGTQDAAYGHAIMSVLFGSLGSYFLSTA